MIILGCIADDFTGASDAASFLVKGGMSVRLYNGIPNMEEKDRRTGVQDPLHDGSDTQAIVIALKSRTQETSGAVSDTLKAARFLLEKGAKQIYFKYCSTFDSTPAGNIGPVADALMELMKVPYTLLCPALPVNGRTVEQGRLMVNGVPLHESHMKNHPLTPMWDCRIEKLMEPQSRYKCYNMDVRKTEAGSGDFVLPEAGTDAPFYLIPDYKTTEDGEKIVEVFGRLPLLTGGSGLLEPLARMWTSQGSGQGRIPESGTEGAALLVAGSCSKATLGQIAWYERQGNPCYKLNPESMIAGTQTADDAWTYIEENKSRGQAVLVYSSDTPERVREFQKLGAGRVAELLESAVAQIAVRAVKNGYTRIISAGGETSGAVTKALGFSSYLVGESAAPGVPVLVPAERQDIRLILKSGNFGQEDFFGRALEMTRKGGKE